MAFYVINPEIEQAIWTNTGAFLVSTPSGDISTANISGTLTVVGGGISVNDFSDIIHIQYVNNFADFQTALTNLSGFGGGKVIISEGTMVITSTVDIPSNVIIEGSGIGATILQATTNLNSVMLNINISTDNVIIRNLTIDGNATNQSLTFNLVNIAGSSSRILIKDCNFLSSYDNNSHFINITTNTSDIVVRDCRLEQLVAPASAGSGIFCNGSNVLIAGNTFVSNYEPIILSPNADNIIIKGNNITTFGSPVATSNGTTQVLIEGNVLESQTASSPMISIDTGGTRIQVLNNILRTSAGSGIAITGTATECLIEGNSITGTTGDVIDISGLTDEFVAITKNNAQEDLTDPATITGTADRVLITTTTATTTNIGDLTTDCAGHTLYVELSVDVGDLTLTATSTDGWSSITLDDAGDWVILEWIGNAWIIKSSSGTIIIDTIQPRQQIDYSLEDLYYDGTTVQDFPDNSVIVLTAGNHLVNYSVAFTTSDTSNVVSTFFRDADTNTIIDESKTIFSDSINTGKHTISKQFIHTVASGTQTLKLSYILSAGTATTSAVELSLLENTDCPTFDQSPAITSIFLDTLTVQENTYTGADINYNGTTVVNVPSTITLTNGTWLVGYSVALKAPTSGDSVSIFLEDTGSTVITNSKTFITESTTTSRHVVSKYFLYTEGAGPTTYRIGFRTNTLVDTSVAVEINTIGGALVVPNQSVNIWAIDVSALTTTQATYTTLTDINYNGPDYVDVPINITLSSAGDYLVGYSLALRSSTSSLNNTLITLRDNSTDDIFALSKTFFQDNSSDSRHTITKSFLYRKTTSTSETLKISFKLQNINGPNPAVEMTALSGITNPDQVPLLWAIRLADVPSNLGTSFLDLIDTPNTYAGFSGKAVVVNPAETGLTYGTFFSSSANPFLGSFVSIVSNPVGFPATINAQNPSFIRIGDVKEFTCSFILTTATPPTNPLDLTYVFEFTLSDLPAISIPTDVQVIATGYAYPNLGSLLTTNFVVNNVIAFANPSTGNIRVSYNHTGGADGIIHVITVNVKYFPV